MGVSTLACDPPRAETEGAGGFHDLESLIEACDVICLHTPLVREGRHATRHLMDAERIARLSPGPCCSMQGAAIVSTPLRLNGA